MLVDEFVNGCEKGSSQVRFPCFEKIDELLNGLLLLRRQGIDEIGKVLGCHECLPSRSIPGLLVATGQAASQDAYRTAKASSPLGSDRLPTDGAFSTQSL